MTLEDVLKAICYAAAWSSDTMDIGTRMPDGDQPLHLAVIQSNPEYVRILLAHGADPNSKGDMDKTPLHYAASRNNREIIEMLLAAGASPHLLNDFNRTPLDSCDSEELRELMRTWVPKNSGNQQQA